MIKTNKRLLGDALVLIENLEKELFKTNDKTITLDGVEYSRSDLHNIQRAIQVSYNKRERDTETSSKYLKKNPEYNRITRMVYYYRKKKNKTPADFYKLEKLEGELEKLKTVRDKKNINKNMQNVIKLRKALDTKTYNESPRTYEEQEPIEEAYIEHE